jgi:hypothetical protein
LLNEAYDKRKIIQNRADPSKIGLYLKHIVGRKSSTQKINYVQLSKVSKIRENPKTSLICLENKNGYSKFTITGKGSGHFFLRFAYINNSCKIDYNGQSFENDGQTYYTSEVFKIDSPNIVLNEILKYLNHDAEDKDLYDRYELTSDKLIRDYTIAARPHGFSDYSFEAGTSRHVDTKIDVMPWNEGGLNNREAKVRNLFPKGEFENEQFSILVTSHSNCIECYVVKKLEARLSLLEDKILRDFQDKNTQLP